MSLRHIDEQIELEMIGGVLIAVGKIARRIAELTERKEERKAA